ncbi:hypothetical protein ES703_105023 [subsurface metagenome]
MPKISGDFVQVLRLLGRTGYIDNDPGQLLTPIPEEKHLHYVIFVALDIGKIFAVRLAVHRRRTVEIMRPAVQPDYRMAQPPAHPARLAILPTLHHCLRHTLQKELCIFRRLHNTFVFADIVPPLESPIHKAWCSMRVRGVQEQLLNVKIRQFRSDNLP